MRQAVTARRLAKSPPAPSPAKRPKRAAPQVTLKELVRLANKQLKTVRGILDGTERPFPGPCGVERPVADVVKFVKKAHNAWLAQLQQRNNVGALQGMIGAGAMVLAGPRGSGKSTAFQAAAKASIVGVAKVTTLRFVTIKGDQLNEDDPNDIFSKVLRSVTNARMDGKRALEELGRLSEPSRFLTVFAVEDVKQTLSSVTLERLLDLAYKGGSPFAVVYMVPSLDRAIELKFEQGMKRRDCRVIHMMPCEEDRLRAILGQSLGASGPDDKDGEVVAGLVNKAALDTIASVVARVSGSIRVALHVCEVALGNRVRELEKKCIAASSSQSPSEAPSAAQSAAASPSAGAGSGGGGGGSSSSRGSPSPTGPKTAAAVTTSSVLLTVDGAKAALNEFLAWQTETPGKGAAAAAEVGQGTTPR
ncbi:unnamed protein product [Ectocarpus sp. CCAP 1310/34]|nr:unnamed protein product [Ectocarpus sp. CCAP 1310/34]